MGAALIIFMKLWNTDGHHEARSVALIKYIFSPQFFFNFIFIGADEKKQLLQALKMENMENRLRNFITIL